MFLPAPADSWISLGQSVDCVGSTKEVQALGLAIVSPLSAFLLCLSLGHWPCLVLRWLFHHRLPPCSHPNCSLQCTPFFFWSLSCKSKAEKWILTSQLRTGRRGSQENTHFSQRVRAYWHNCIGHALHWLLNQHVFAKKYNFRYWWNFLHSLLTGLAMGAEGSPLSFWNVLEDLKSRCDSWPILDSV